MLGPARRADRPVDVARLQSEPIHRRQMAHRIALARMADQLGLGGGARGEVFEQRRGDRTRVGRHENLRACGRIAIVGPAGGRAAVRAATRVAGQDAADARECCGRQFADARLPGGVGQDPAHLAALDAIGQIGTRQQGGGRNDHRTDLDRRQHGLPERDFVAQHQQDAITGTRAAPDQKVGDLRGTTRQFGVAQLGLGARLLDDMQGRCRVVARHRIEVVDCPVEAIKPGPGEGGVGRRMIGAQREQLVAGGKKAAQFGVGFGHGLSLYVVAGGVFDCARSG